MLLALNAASQSIDIQFVDDSGLALTGKVATDFPTIKYSQAGTHADATLSLSDLSTITTAWSSGGVKERGDGVYRLDIPDAIGAAAGEWTIRGESSGKHVLCPKIDVAVTVATVTNQLTAAQVATGVWQDTTSGDFTVSGSIGKSLFTAGNAPGAASGLLVAGSNAATTFASGSHFIGTVDTITTYTGNTLQTGDSYVRLGAPAGVSIAADLAEIEAETDALLVGVTVAAYASGQDPATLVLDVAASGHNATGTVGAKINSAASAGDPLLNDVPGSYASGTAGNVLGHLLGAQIATVSPVSQGGTISLVQGDDYSNSDGRALEWTGTTSNVWPDLTNATIALYVNDALLCAGSVVTPTGTQKVRVQPTAAQTAALTEGTFNYQVKATLATSGRVVTLVNGPRQCVVSDNEAS